MPGLPSEAMPFGKRQRKGKFGHCHLTYSSVKTSSRARNIVCKCAKCTSWPHFAPFCTFKIFAHCHCYFWYCPSGVTVYCNHKQQIDQTTLDVVKELARITKWFLHIGAWSYFNLKPQLNRVPSVPQFWEPVEHSEACLSHSIAFKTCSILVLIHSSSITSLWQHYWQMQFKFHSPSSSLPQESLARSSTIIWSFSSPSLCLCIFSIIIKCKGLQPLSKDLEPLECKVDALNLVHARRHFLEKGLHPGLHCFQFLHAYEPTPKAHVGKSWSVCWASAVVASQEPCNLTLQPVNVLVGGYMHVHSLMQHWVQVPGAKIEAFSFQDCSCICSVTRRLFLLIC